MVEANGREYRIWIQDDTGYDIGITSSKPITANARTSLTWSRSPGASATSPGHGACAPVASPIGSFDVAGPAGPEKIASVGWALNQDTAAPIAVHVYVDSGRYRPSPPTYRARHRRRLPRLRRPARLPAP